MQYPLTEKIGRPELFVGREAEFQLLNRWLAKIPQRLAKSKALLARRKSGKTCLVQRIFNRLWSENGQVIPFYFGFDENNTWLPDLAIKYYCTFASQYISCLERDVTLIRHPLTLKEIQEYGKTKVIKPFLDDVELLLENRGPGSNHNLMWDTACSAPHRLFALFDRRVLVILDEFQYITRYIYRDPHCQGTPDDTLAGSYHHLAESKVAPLL